MLSTPDSFLDEELPTESEGAFSTGILQAEETTKKDYRAAYIYINVTSYSQRQTLHKCPRHFQIYKNPAVGGAVGVTNLDFVFGHSVGTGLQTYITTRSKNAALFAAFLAWRADLDAVHHKKYSGKNSTLAFLAVEKFIVWWESVMAKDWEIATFNGKPATELTFFLDMQNGYYHAGHVDAVLRNRVTGKYMVLEIKTTAIKNVDEAQYGNSEQPLGYSLVLDKIVTDLNVTKTFEVLYFVYSTSERKLIPMPFTKSRSERMEWLQDLLLDHTTISTYRKLSFFPQRGDSCWSFGGRCPHYGVCNLSAYKNNTKFLVFDRATMQLPEPVDFEFTLGDITKAILKPEATEAQNG